MICEWSDQHCRCDKLLADSLPPWCCRRNAVLPLESVRWFLWLLSPYLLLCIMFSRHCVISCFLLEETPEWAFYVSPQNARKAECFFQSEGPGYFSVSWIADLVEREVWHPLYTMFTTVYRYDWEWTVTIAWMSPRMKQHWRPPL